MKRKYLLFLLLALLIHMVLSFAYQGLMAESALYQSDRSLCNLGQDTKVIIAGHSHAMALSHPDWTDAKNIASAGEVLHQSYSKLRYAIEEAKTRPELIVFPLDLGALRNYNPDRQSYQGYWNRYENSHELAQFSENSIDFWAYRLIGRILPYKDGLHDLVDYLFADSLEQREAMRRQGRKNINQRPDTLQRERIDGCLEQQFSAYGLHYLHATVELAHRHGIELVFVRFPVTRGFYFKESSCYEPEDYYRVLTDSLNDWQGTYRLMDFHDAFPDSVFRDPHHLEAGPTRLQFTEMLRAALESDAGSMIKDAED